MNDITMKNEEYLILKYYKHFIYSMNIIIINKQLLKASLSLLKVNVNEHI